MSEKQQDFTDFGLSKEETEKIKDVVPIFNLGNLEEGQTAKFKIISVKPEKVTWTDKKTNDERTTPTVRARDVVTDMEVSLWLSSKSLQMEFYKLFQKHNTLKDLNIVIGVRNYTHPVWGDNTRGYIVQEDTAHLDFQA